MRKHGFSNITVRDISSHVISSYFYVILIASLYLAPAMIKMIIHFKEGYDYNKDFDTHMALSFPLALLSLFGCFKYYSITGTK